MSDVTAESAKKLIDDNPVFAGKVARFMTLYDAAQILSEMKPPNEPVISYLHDVARYLMAPMPEDFIQAMIAARPPMPGTLP